MLSFISTDSYLILIPGKRRSDLNHEIMVCAVRECIAPALLRVREGLVAMAIRELGPASFKVEAAKKLRTMSFDGENDHLFAVMQ